MEPIDPDLKWKRAISRLAEGIPSNPKPVEELLRKGRRQSRLRLSLALVPAVAAALLILMTTVPVFAGNQTLPQWWAGRQLEQASEVWDRSALVPILMIKFRANPDIVREMLAQGMRPGEVAIGALMSRLSQRSLREIATLRRKGLGWGRIAQELGLDWQSLRNYLRRMNPIEPGGTKRDPVSLDSRSRDGL